MKFEFLNDFDFKKFIANNRKIVAVYLVWLFVNTTILLCSNGSRAYFYPFYNSEHLYRNSLLSVYDFSEYFFYITGPILGFVLYQLLKGDKNKL